MTWMFSLSKVPCSSFPLTSIFLGSFSWLDACNFVSCWFSLFFIFCRAFSPIGKLSTPVSPTAAHSVVCGVIYFPTLIPAFINLLIFTVCSPPWLRSAFPWSEPPIFSTSPQIGQGTLFLENHRILCMHFLSSRGTQGPWKEGHRSSEHDFAWEPSFY